MYRIIFIVAIIKPFNVLWETGRTVTFLTIGSTAQIFKFKLVARGSAAALNNAVV
jgi:hypothetical protein